MKLMSTKLFAPNPYPTDIDKEALALLPKAECPIPIHIIDNKRDVAKAMRALQEVEAVGLDTETKPSFTPGRRNSVALLQIATDEQCFLFRLNRIGLPPELSEFLACPDILKVGLSLDDDRRALNRLGQIEGEGFVELQQLCLGYGIRTAASLQKIYAIVFGERMSKAQQLSNWEARVLTPAQQSYAALDAWGSLRIYRRMLEHPAPHPAQFALLRIQ